MQTGQTPEDRELSIIRVIRYATILAIKPYRAKLNDYLEQFRANNCQFDDGLCNLRFVLT